GGNGDAHVGIPEGRIAQRGENVVEQRAVRQGRGLYERAADSEQRAGKGLLAVRCSLPAHRYASGYSRYPWRTRSGCMRSPSFSLRRDSKPFTPVWSVPVRMQTNSPPRLWQTMSSWRQSAASDLLSSASSSFALIQ